jgi:hypothetical protein
MTRIAFWFGLFIVPVVLLALIPPIAQPQWYHEFADQRTLLGIPHALNVISNLPFLVVGLWGLWHLARGARPDQFEQPRDVWFYGVFFAAVALTGIGSAYYHADPTNDRLLWDRLPLAVAFMALFAMILAERVSYRAGVALFVPLVLAGAGSVVYWHVTEQWGHGDFRPYLIVQLFPLLLIPLIFVLFPARFTGTGDLLAALLCYLMAKGLELLDRQVYAQGQIVSGHTLKHFMAALAPYFILHSLQQRRRLGGDKVNVA